MLIGMAFWFWASALVCSEEEVGLGGGGGEVVVSEVSEVLYRPRGDSSAAVLLQWRISYTDRDRQRLEKKKFKYFPRVSIHTVYILPYNGNQIQHLTHNANQHQTKPSISIPTPEHQHQQHQHHPNNP